MLVNYIILFINLFNNATCYVPGFFLAVEDREDKEIKSLILESSKKFSKG